MLQINDDEFSLAGSSSHVFPASEISHFSVTGKGITLKLDENCLDPGLIYIRIPSYMAGFPVNGIPRHAEDKLGLNLIVIEAGELPKSV